MHKKENFDVVHQLTQIAFREPGYWWKLGIPFFWGPTGGLNSLPKEFLDLLSRKSRILESIRTLSNFFQFNYSSRVIRANKTASVIYTYSVDDAIQLKKRASGEVKLMLDVGTRNPGGIQNNERVNSSVIKGIWCGQLIERKAPIILLKALALSKSTKEEIKIQIIGSGPLETTLRKQSKAFGLNNIEWRGSVDHETVFKLMSDADFFVHTSLREATSSVIPEALSTGLPVICHNASGMSIAINDTCGIKIPFISPGESVRGFHNAMESLILNKKLLGELKIGASKRSLEISWDRMAETIANDYTAIVNEKNNK